MEDKMVKCPCCDGSGINGYDRSYPDPNPYVCELCGGEKEISEEREIGWNVNWHTVSNQENYCREAREAVEVMRRQLIDLGNRLLEIAGVKGVKIE